MLRAQTLTWLGLALIGLGCGPTSSPKPEPASQPEQAPKPATIAEPSDGPDTEVAFLDAHPDHAQVSEQARDEAKQCDAGDATQCRGLANRYEEGIGAPSAPDRALALYERGCAQGLGHHCLLGGWLATATRDADQREVGLALLRRGCELDHLHACVSAAAVLGQAAAANGSESDEIATLRAKACRGGYAIACDGDQPPDPKVAPASAEAACPARFHWSTSQSGGPRLHGTAAQLDHEAMLATIPERVPEFTTERRSSTPAGRAGTRSASANVELARGETRVSLSIFDTAADCTLQPGTGAAMIADIVDRHGGPAIEVSGSPAVVLDTGLTVWVADRCQVTWSAAGLVEPELLALAEGIDWPALAKLCAQRP